MDKSKEIDGSIKGKNLALIGGLINISIKYVQKVKINFVIIIENLIPPHLLKIRKFEYGDQIYSVVLVLGEKGLLRQGTWSNGNACSSR